MATLQNHINSITTMPSTAIVAAEKDGIYKGFSFTLYALSLLHALYKYDAYKLKYFFIL